MLSIDKVTLNVRDQEAALRFWTELMGFQLVRDEPMGEPGGPRWLEVREPGNEVSLVLFAPEFDPGKVGHLGDVLFTCDDIRRTHTELAARGVRFREEPHQQGWGWWATFSDPEGNVYGMTQREPG